METKKSNKANLRNKKLLFFEIGAILSLAVVLLAFEWSTKDVNVQIFDDHRAVIVDPDMITIQPEQPERLEEIKVPVATDVISIVDIDVPDIHIPTENFPTDPIGKIVYIDPKPAEETVEEIDFAIVEDKPLFMGGDVNQFSKWVSSKIIYPQAALANGVQGRVWVQFTIATDGSVTNVKVIQGIDSSLDREAIRVISSSEKWTPGKQHKKPVRVVYRVPVIFQIR